MGEDPAWVWLGGGRTRGSMMPGPRACVFDVMELRTDPGRALGVVQ